MGGRQSAIGNRQSAIGNSSGERNPAGGVSNNSISRCERRTAALELEMERHWRSHCRLP